jgi:hypothetical protein
VRCETLRPRCHCVSRRRVIDQFRSWDTDKTGSINKEEWRKAIALFGFVPTAGAVYFDEEVDALFDEIDADGSGEIEYEELNRTLRVGSRDMLARSLSRKSLGSSGRLSNPGSQARGSSKNLLERRKPSGKLALEQAAAEKAAEEQADAERQAAADKARAALFYDRSWQPSPHFPNRSSKCAVLPSSSFPPSPRTSSLDATPNTTPAALVSPRVRPPNLVLPSTKLRPSTPAQRPATHELTRRPAPLGAMRQRPATASAGLAGVGLPPELPVPRNRYTFDATPLRLMHTSRRPGSVARSAPISTWMSEQVASINFTPRHPALVDQHALHRSMSAPGGAHLGLGLVLPRQAHSLLQLPAAVGA